ncbi:glutathione S-transferase family protein [Caulobacter sp. S45]|uniref:glutathione S-transferase family protein n=1 Tax=Caulobacter sp. S45 TaxID=1641861 RepID=UPI00131AD784|nr:glutathione S-transferase family protein [Caulobacter sp. S45]
MYSLYYSPGTASLAVHWMLIELGVPFELRLVDIETKAQRSPEYLAINPSGQVPAMVIEGVAYAECAALLMLLAERHPERGFAPPPGDPQRAAYLQWMIYFANTLQPAFRAWFYADEPAGAANAEAAMAAARSRIETAWDRLDGVFADGRPFLLGERLSATDFLAAMLTRWSRNMPRPAAAWPHLGAYVARMRSMPSLREVHVREGLADWIDG